MSIIPLKITLAQYLGAFADRIADEVITRAEALLERLNAVIAAAADDGVEFHVNPATGCLVAGNGHGGVRVPEESIGADHSKHKSGEACDVYDPERHFLAWILRNKARVMALGILAVERSEYTPTWAHCQDVAVGSGSFAFVPARDAKVLAGALPEQALA